MNERYRHVSGDEDGQCSSCLLDDEPSTPHAAELVGTDAEGAYCWCGHSVEPDE